MTTTTAKNNASFMTVYIRGNGLPSGKSINATKILREVVENTRTSFEVEGFSFSDRDWSKVKKAKDLLSSVI